MSSVSDTVSSYSQYGVFKGSLSSAISFAASRLSSRKIFSSGFCSSSAAKAARFAKVSAFEGLPLRFGVFEACSGEDFTRCADSFFFAFSLFCELSGFCADSFFCTFSSFCAVPVFRAAPAAFELPGFEPVCISACEFPSAAFFFSSSAAKAALFAKVSAFGGLPRRFGAVLASLIISLFLSFSVILFFFLHLFLRIHNSHNTVTLKYFREIYPFLLQTPKFSQSSESAFITCSLL